MLFRSIQVNFANQTLVGNKGSKILKKQQKISQFGVLSNSENLRFGSSSCSIWTSYTSFESSWPADLDYLSFGSVP